MAIKKVITGWQVDFRPEGRKGKRVRKTFKLKKDAENFEKIELAAALGPDYIAHTKDDNRKLSEIGKAWYTYHGNTLRSGAKSTQQIEATARAMGDPTARLVDGRDFITYRDNRLSEVNPDGTAKVTRNHMNHELSYLKSAFKKLIEIGDWKTGNPFEKIRPLPIKKRTPFFLHLPQVREILSELETSRNPDAYIIAKICLSIGCRWGEAQYLKAQDVRVDKIDLQETKNGRTRSIPIDTELYEEIVKGRPRTGRLFGNAWNAFDFAVARTSVQLPKGTATHVLRHTFASHFMMDGGNLLQLNKILGHETIEMTMRYAHLAPEHLNSAMVHNTIKRLEREKRVIPDGHNVDTLGKSL